MWEWPIILFNRIISDTESAHNVIEITSDLSIIAFNWLQQYNTYHSHSNDERNHKHFGTQSLTLSKGTHLSLILQF